jgi:predicted GIY-YIG superfamily endonuclease
MEMVSICQAFGKYQEGLTHSKAHIREAQIKAMPRTKKKEIIFNGHGAQPAMPAGN